MNIQFYPSIPRFSSTHNDELKAPRPTQTVDTLNLSSLPSGRHHLWLNLLPNKMGAPTQIPVMVLKGTKPGPVVGITSAIHGNELNGIAVIGELFDTIQPENLKGTILAVPVMNVRGYAENDRLFDNHDKLFGKVDLNRLMPGKTDRGEAGHYAKALMEKFIQHCNLIIDFHDEGFGRQSVSYLKAPELKTAIEYRPDFIERYHGELDSLTGELKKKNIPIVSFEIGNANVFEKNHIDKVKNSILNYLHQVNITPNNLVDSDQLANTTWLIRKEHPIDTGSQGGLLTVIPPLGANVLKGQPVAELRNTFWEKTKVYKAPVDGLVMMKATNPAVAPGTPFMRLGEIEKPIHHESGQTIPRNKSIPITS